MLVKSLPTLLFLLLTCSIKAQNVDSTSKKSAVLTPKTDNSARKLRPSPIYVDGSAGLIIPSFHFMADASVGYRINDNLGVGVTAITMGNYDASAKGGGVQLRWTPERHTLIKVEVGVIRGASSIDRSGPEVYTYVKKSNDTYFRIGAFYRIGQILTLGICYAKTSPVTFDVSTLVNGQTIPKNRSWSYSIGVFTPQIGIAIPDMPKKEKKIQVF
jgi:hypothetical protein